MLIWSTFPLREQFFTVLLLFINLKKNTAVILHILYSVSDDSDKLGFFIRPNKLINTADSESLHNLSNVNSHLNYPNFILNLQNPITS